MLPSSLRNTRILHKIYAPGRQKADVAAMPLALERCFSRNGLAGAWKGQVSSAMDEKTTIQYYCSSIGKAAHSMERKNLC